MWTRRAVLAQASVLGGVALVPGLASSGTPEPVVLWARILNPYEVAGAKGGFAAVVFSPFYDAEMEVLYVAKRRVQANFDQRGIAVGLSTVEIATEKDTRWARP